MEAFSGLNRAPLLAEWKLDMVRGANPWVLSAACPPIEALGRAAGARVVAVFSFSR